ncbi:hypothetical protein [Paenibacillus sp. FSL K6-2524]|uniref:hypothetical protein n=1 Tax=Paenibacillus sp. FSL K6-2524 TaxID=2954516 RepID=UPI0030FBFAD7
MIKIIVSYSFLYLVGTGKFSLQTKSTIVSINADLDNINTMCEEAKEKVGLFELVSTNQIKVYGFMRVDDK